MPKSKRILLLLIFALIFHSSTHAHRGDSRLLVRARAHIGRGESGSNNCGPDIRLYLRGRENQPWCAAFISYILNKEGITELGYSLSAREIYNKAKKLDWLVDNPKTGDLIVFWRVSLESWKGHIGIITEINGGEIVTIEGNRGAYPAQVERFRYNRYDVPHLLGYIRIGGEK